MMRITSLHQYRKYGYVLRVGDIHMALALLGLDNPELVAQKQEARPCGHGRSGYRRHPDRH